MLSVIVGALLAAGSGQAAATATNFEIADARLNAVYAALRATLPEIERIDLRKSERQWIATRNDQCGREQVNTCSTALTRKRIAEMEAAIQRDRRYTSLSTVRLIDLNAELSSACKDSFEGDAGVVCNRRDLTTRLLESKGLCWGPDDADEAGSRWMPAGASCHN